MQRYVIISKRQNVCAFFSLKSSAFEFDINDSLFIDQYETRRLKKFTGILYYGSNEVLVIDDLRIKPIISNTGD